MCSLMVSSWAELHHGSGGDNLSPGNRKTNEACLVNTKPSCGSPPPHRGELLVRGGGGGWTCPPSSSGPQHQTLVVPDPEDSCRNQRLDGDNER